MYFLKLLRDGNKHTIGPKAENFIWFNMLTLLGMILLGWLGFNGCYSLALEKIHKIVTKCFDFQMNCLRLEKFETVNHMGLVGKLRDDLNMKYRVLRCHCEGKDKATLTTNKFLYTMQTSYSVAEHESSKRNFCKFQHHALLRHNKAIHLINSKESFFSS